MQSNSDIIVSDTSCLVILSKIDELELLKKVSKKVYVTPIIHEESRHPEWEVEGVLRGCASLIAIIQSERPKAWCGNARKRRIWSTL